MTKTTYHGSCYCKAVRFTADIDFETTPTGRCNCTSCRKRRWWAVQIAPEDFHLEAGEDHVLKIPTNGGSTLHVCPSCGVLVYGTTPKQEWNDGAARQHQRADPRRSRCRNPARRAGGLL